MELAKRLIQMFSFVGDTVFGPFMGTGTTTLAAMQHGRSSIGSEIDEEYFAHTERRIRDRSLGLFSKTTVNCHE